MLLAIKLCTRRVTKTMCYDSEKLQKTLRIPSATDILFKAAKRQMNLFPRVQRARSDAILFKVQCHGVSHGERCFLLVNGLQDDNSNVRTFHWCPRFLTMFSRKDNLKSSNLEHVLLPPKAIKFVLSGLIMKQLSKHQLQIRCKLE